MSKIEDLNSIRSEIMKLTLEIIQLAGERLALAKKIGKIKAQKNMPIEDPEIERELREKVVELSRKLNVDAGFSLKLLNLLLEESKRVQKEIMMSNI